MSELGDQAFARGAVVAGRYQIKGEGAKAKGLRFYSAVENTTGAAVCLAFCAPSEADTFLAKAKRVAALHHPNIAPVREILVEAGRPAVVYEASSDVDLGTWRRALGRPPTPAEFDKIAGQLLDAVAALHGAGALHLRITSGAVTFEADDCVSLAPFGAWRGDDADAAAFSPPELASGSASQGDERADIFGCAATLIALIDGRPPSSAGGLPVPIAASGSGFRSEALQALATAVSPDPADRPPSARALAALLFDFPSAAPGAPPPSVMPRQSVARRSKGGAIWAALAALAVLLIGGLYALDFSPPWREARRLTERAEVAAPSSADSPAQPQSKPSPEPPIDPAAQRVMEIASMTNRDALAALTIEATPIGETAKARLKSLGYILARNGAAPRWLKPGEAEVFRDCADCPEMVAIPAGDYLMGSPSNEPGRTDDEDDTPGPGGSPVVITIPDAFGMTRGEITRGEYAAFAADTKRADDGGCFARRGARTLDPVMSWREPGFAQDDRHPVVCVSYDDALAYAEWLSKRAGAKYRVPSEAEYEFAARAGMNSGGRYFWGDDATSLCSYANGADAAAREHNPDWVVAPCHDGFAWTAPVGSFRPNAFGLHDMLGNVWEWTSDCASDSLSQAARGGPAGCASNADRILRGGSWSDPPERLRLAARIAGPPAARDQIVGFRLVREIPR